jgi:glutamate-ammonia-ligase adenylyltransferase
MPLSSQLQQHWQTVAGRLPADFPVSTLSDRAQSVMAFSDFVEQSLIAQPQWLAELESAPPRRRSGITMPTGCRFAWPRSMMKPR